MDNSFEIQGKKFKVRKMDAMKQFHIVRRIGPLLAEILPAMQKVAKINLEALTEDQKLEQTAKIAAPFMEGLSKLSDADANYILYGLLNVVEVYQEKFSSWAHVSSGDAILMQDLELPVLFQAAGKAFQFNLSGFFSMLPRA